jgi:hypothetical protein
MLWSNISSEFCPTSLRRPTKPSKASFIFYPVFKDAPVLLSTVRKHHQGPSSTSQPQPRRTSRLPFHATDARENFLWQSPKPREPVTVST